MSVHVPTEFFSRFRAQGWVRKLPPQANIYTQGDPAENFYLVTSGRVRVFTLSLAGRETTVEILETGRIFGEASFLSSVHRHVTIQTVTDAEIVICRAEQMLALCRESTEIMALLFQHMAETCDYLTHQINRLAHYNSHQKVADFLLCESEHRGQTQPGTVLPYTHGEIADSVSLNRVTVSRVLLDFKASGLISNQYGAIGILNRKGLAALLEK